MSYRDARRAADRFFGWKEKLAAWVLLRRLKEDDMPQFLVTLLRNLWPDGKVPTMVGLALCAFNIWVQNYCAIDTETGVWMDANCATLMRIASYVAPIGLLLAPGFSATRNSSGGRASTGRLSGLVLLLLIPIFALLTVGGCSGGGDDPASCDVTATSEVNGTIIAQCADGTVCIGSSCASEGSASGDVDNRPNSGNTTDSGNTSSETTETTTTNHPPPADG